MKKHKMTGCARLFIALIIIAPLAYLAAAYYNGEDGIQNIQEFLGIKGKDDADSGDDTYRNTDEDLRNATMRFEERIEALEKENTLLKEENARLRKEIEQLKNPGGEIQ